MGDDNMLKNNSTYTADSASLKAAGRSESMETWLQVVIAGSTAA